VCKLKKLDNQKRADVAQANEDAEAEEEVRGRGCRWPPLLLQQ